MFYRHIYAIASYLCAPFYVLVLWWKNTIGITAHRFGYIPYQAQQSIWIHGASYGEIASLYALVTHIRLENPNVALIITTNTPDGYRLIGQEYPYAVAAYLPIDTPHTIRIALHRVKPIKLIVTEAERWYGLYSEAHRYGATVIAYNARLSNRSVTNGFMHFFLRHIYQKCNYIMTQQPDPFVKLNLPASTHISIMGSAKAATVLRKHAASSPQKVATPLPVLLVGSLHQDELAVYVNLYKRLEQADQSIHMILVPRHITWSNVLRKEIATCTQNSFEYTKDRSHCLDSVITQRAKNKGITTISTMGSLAHLYRYATLFYLGGTFNSVGGHAVLEAAAHQLPILTGPNLHETNYEAHTLEKGGGLSRSDDAAQLFKITESLLTNDTLHSQMGKQNNRWLRQQNSGVHLPT